MKRDAALLNLMRQANSIQYKEVFSEELSHFLKELRFLKKSL